MRRSPWVLPLLAACSSEPAAAPPNDAATDVADASDDVPPDVAADARPGDSPVVTPDAPDDADAPAACGRGGARTGH